MPPPLKELPKQSASVLEVAERTGEFDLDHHGDDEVGAGLVDLAVNVRTGTPPGWLVEAITQSLHDLASYPRQDAALAAVAARHGCAPAQVLLTAGAAEAFVLVARAFRPRHAVVVHPQFTEPEAALRSAGHQVDRVVLRASDGFCLAPELVPTDADLVVVGNPTNPTSVLHRAEELRALARPGRILIVDEAFMDAVPGEPESLVGAEVPGLIVIRSLTKTWGLAGLRVGYVVAEPGLIGQLAEVQPHWPVSTPALAAAIACSNRQALAESARAAVELDHQRAYLLDGLLTPRALEPALPDRGAAAPVDVSTYGVARAPFVLVRVSGGTAAVRVSGGTAAVRVSRAAGVRGLLRERGFAVRRGDTFPGLGPDWLRIAVRPQAITDGFLAAWHESVAEVELAELEGDRRRTEWRP